MNHQNEITRLFYELTYHRYLLNRSQSTNLFTELTIAEYIALHSIVKVADTTERIFLKDLAQKLEMPLSAASRMVRKLKERSLVLWSHDGDGGYGTYVSITSAGVKALNQQDQLLNAYYHRVIDAFGEKEMAQLMQQLDRLERIMDEIFAEGGTDDESDAAE